MKYAITDALVRLFNKGYRQTPKSMESFRRLEPLLGKDAPKINRMLYAADEGVVREGLRKIRASEGARPEDAMVAIAREHPRSRARMGAIDEISANERMLASIAASGGRGGSFGFWDSVYQVVALLESKMEDLEHPESFATLAKYSRKDNVRKWAADQLAELYEKGVELNDEQLELIATHTTKVDLALLAIKDLGGDAARIYRLGKYSGLPEVRQKVNGMLGRIGSRELQVSGENEVEVTADGLKAAQGTGNSIGLLKRK